MPILSLRFPLNFQKPAFAFPSKYTPGPRTIPAVLGAHPADAMVKGCTAGATIRALAAPRVHECAIVHGSRCTFTSPYSFIFAAVHSFACFVSGDPVNRGPMLSDKYSRLCITSE